MHYCALNNDQAEETFKITFLDIYIISIFILKIKILKYRQKKIYLITMI